MGRDTGQRDRTRSIEQQANSGHTSCMRSRTRAVLILPAAGLAVLLAWLIASVRHGEGPAYKGASLSYWLDRTRGGTDNGEEVQEAIDHLGTNALPFLLKWLRYERPAWRDTLYEKAPVSVENLALSTAELRADASEEALIYLGTNAAGALRGLTALASDTNAPDTADRAMSAMASAGPSGLEALLEIARDPNNPRFFAAIARLGQTPVDDPFQPLKVAALVQLMGETNRPVVRHAAASFLGQQTRTAALAVPHLIRCLTNDTSDSDMRVHAIMALVRFGTNSLPALTNALTDPSPAVRRAATNAISGRAIRHDFRGL